MSELVGRARESQVLQAALDSPSAELVAVYGRRRVGKTFLVRQFFVKELCFELMGMYNATLRTQLGSFSVALGRTQGAAVPPREPATWVEAFCQLSASLERLPRTRKKRVLFFDELPWLASRRSGFLSAFEHWWNSWGSSQPHLVVVICGSAASWMISKVLRSRGGLHNRVTRRIRLEPFSLGEVAEYLEHRRVILDRYQTIELYLALGGIPHYLKEIQRGESAAQCIERVCFSKDGLLWHEFEDVYASLFEHSERHQQVVRALAKKHTGLTRNELLRATGLPSGGSTTTVLRELEASGFIMTMAEFGRNKKDEVFRLVDPPSLFHLKWIEGYRSRAAGAWTRKRGTPAWQAWAGYAFENVCLLHVEGIRRALGISGVETTESSWHYRADDEPGAQIDLVIDRADRSINLCEMKYTESDFVVTKAYAGQLRARRDLFRRTTRTPKALFTTLVTPHGVRANAHRDSAVDALVDGDALFAR